MSIDIQAGLSIYSQSVIEADDTTYFLVQGTDDEDKRLGIEGDATGFDGAMHGHVTLCPLTPANAAALRRRLPWLAPRPLGLQKSAGFGDRLGLATPGHVYAMQHAPGIAPIFAQQSIRENARTGRTPQEVIDEAMWGVFQEGWRAGYGADADHLKTPDDADVTAAAGYTFFTIDPGEYVNDQAHTAEPAALAAMVDALPWSDLDASPDALRTTYLDKAFDLEHQRLAFSEETLLRAAAKYGRAVAHASRMYRHLRNSVGDRPWELEVSVDETATPTSHLEHLYIAAELRRLGVRWVSLAPRYIGRFEKGVDYIGDLAAFRADFAVHAAIARAFGPYKLSLHSGSDKFSIYPIAAEVAGELVHLKTAGTSYLEALRAVAGTTPDLFRAIYELAFERYDEDRATYHVSAEATRAPHPSVLSDTDLPDVVDQFDAREMLHVTFGSALARYGTLLKAALRANEDAHYAMLERHFIRHLKPFLTQG